MNNKTIFAIAAIFFGIAAIMSYIGGQVTAGIVATVLTIVCGIFASRPAPHHNY